MTNINILLNKKKFLSKWLDNTDEIICNGESIYFDLNYRSVNNVLFFIKNLSITIPNQIIIEFNKEPSDIIYSTGLVLAPLNNILNVVKSGNTYIVTCQNDFSCLNTIVLTIGSDLFYSLNRNQNITNCSLLVTNNIKFGTPITFKGLNGVVSDTNIDDIFYKQSNTAVYSYDFSNETLSGDFEIIFDVRIDSVFSIGVIDPTNQIPYPMVKFGIVGMFIPNYYFELIINNAYISYYRYIDIPGKIKFKRVGSILTVYTLTSNGWYLQPNYETLETLNVVTTDVNVFIALQANYGKKLYNPVYNLL